MEIPPNTLKCNVKVNAKPKTKITPVRPISNTALIIIDVQNDYFTGGKYELYNPLGALKNIENMLKAFRERKISIIHIQHINGKGASFFERNTKGVKIHKNLTALTNEYLVTKNYPNSFADTNLATIVKENNINKLIICGMMTNVCIDATTRACKEYGINVTLLEDACAARSLILHDDAIARLRGMFANVIKTSEFKF